MTDRDIMQQALKALLTCRWSKQTEVAITALRERLARCDRCDKPLGGPDHIHTCSPQVQEPVGQLQEDAFGRGQVLWFNKPADQTMLYTAPQPEQ